MVVIRAGINQMRLQKQSDLGLPYSPILLGFVTRQLVFEILEHLH